MRQGAPQLAWLLLTLYTCGHLVWESRAPGRPAAVGSSSSSGREEGCPSYPGPAPGAFGAGSVPVDTDCSLVAENSAAAALQAPALGPAGCLWVRRTCVHISATAGHSMAAYLPLCDMITETHHNGILCDQPALLTLSWSTQ
jgi:hypothetical protein